MLGWDDEVWVPRGRRAETARRSQMILAHSWCSITIRASPDLLGQIRCKE